MKYYLILVLFALFTSIAFAQSNYQDVVYLKNGSIIRGIIIEQVPNKSLKIETADRSIFVYQMDEIEKIAKEIVKPNDDSSVKSDGVKNDYHIIEMGYQVGVGDYGIDRYKLNIINGYVISPLFSIGYGTGLRYYFDAESIVLPVFADFRTNFEINELKSYFSLGLGYSLNASNDFDGLGLLINPSFGVGFKLTEKFTMNVGLSYEIQKMKVYSYDGYYSADESTESCGGISFDIGIAF